MCLLAVFHKIHPEGPLLVAANRDEFLARPAAPMGILSPSGPRVLGGKDLLAGGTWLALNERGLVAGLTNRPFPGGRDPAKRSRGELPLALARHSGADDAVSALHKDFSPADFNPAWLLVGDRDALWYVDFSGERAETVPLGAGLHILENRPLGDRSPKAEKARAGLAPAFGLRGEPLRRLLASVLASHELPPGAADAAQDEPGRRPETQAACVHAGPYGTRSAVLAVVPPGSGPPRVWAADGPPCTTPFVDASGLWAA